MFFSINFETKGWESKTKGWGSSMVPPFGGNTVNPSVTCTTCIPTVYITVVLV